MKYLSTLSVCAFLCTSTVDAIRLVQRDSPRVVSLPIQRRQIDNPLERERLRRRQTKTLQETLDNFETLYLANGSLGTPPKNFRMHLDTGSSDLWVNTPQSTLCTSRGNPCAASGTYSANESSTYRYVNSDFNISYVDGSGALGDYATDTFQFSGQTLTDLQFGIGYSSSSTESILGIGYTTNEVQAARAGLQPYPNLPQKLVDQGIISTNAYSLWLNDLDASTGSILFGGVDTQKYRGSLATLPILKSRNQFSEFVITLTGMGFDGEANSIFSGETVPVLLDSGSTLTYLPDEVVEPIYQRYGAQYNSRQGAAFVDCALANQQGSVDFTFTSPTISVTLDELVVVAAVQRGRPLCILGIAPNGGSISVLGDTFLRSAYVVYDLQNNEISLAQTNFNATESNIMEITASGGVPDAAGVAGAPSNIAVAGGGGRIGGPQISGTNAARMVRQSGVPMGAWAAAGAGLLLALS